MPTSQQPWMLGTMEVNLTTNATTANGNASKAGDIVKAADGEYYRTIRDRTKQLPLHGITTPLTIQLV